MCITLVNPKESCLWLRFWCCCGIRCMLSKYRIKRDLSEIYFLSFHSINIFIPPPCSFLLAIQIDCNLCVHTILIPRSHCRSHLHYLFKWYSISLHNSSKVKALLISWQIDIAALAAKWFNLRDKFAFFFHNSSYWARQQGDIQHTTSVPFGWWWEVVARNF